MSVYHTTLRRRQPVAEGTQAFHFDKPAGFDFRPGQAIDLILPLPGVAADSQDARHAFSIVSAPHENELVVATRMRDSAYKRALGALPDGAAVQVDGPFGSLTLIGIGGSPFGPHPCHTTGHAGPHPAVREFEVKTVWATPVGRSTQWSAPA